MTKHEAQDDTARLKAEVKSLREALKQMMDATTHQERQAAWFKANKVYHDTMTAGQVIAAALRIAMTQPPTHRVHENEHGEFVIVLPNGNFARDTNCEIWVTADRALADQALAYITQPI